MFRHVQLNAVESAVRVYDHHFYKQSFRLTIGKLVGKLVVSYRKGQVIHFA